MENKRRVEVVAYNPNWSYMFEEEVKVLKGILGEVAADFHHIGSTAIIGIHAKPIIDVMVEVDDLAAVDQLEEIFKAKGYIPMGENGIAERRFFIKGSFVQRSHHIHIFKRGIEEVKRHINYRDYLNNHPAEAQVYSDLKISLAKTDPENIEAYIKGKDQLIKEIDEKAKKWRERMQE